MEQPLPFTDQRENKTLCRHAELDSVSSFSTGFRFRGNDITVVYKKRADKLIPALRIKFEYLLSLKRLRNLLQHQIDFHQQLQHQKHLLHH